MKQLGLLCIFAAGCILPVSTGAPLPATTVGRGNWGAAVSGEAPTLDLIADNDDNASTDANDAISYGAAPAAALTFTLSYGLGEDTDLEVAGDGALYYFILPLPTGGSIGLRQHIAAGDAFDVAVAARIGHVGSTATVTDSNGNETESGASANYGAFQVVVQSKRGVIRPLLALNLMPARIQRDPSDADPFHFSGLASSLTGGVMFVGSHALIGPYITATNFYSDRFDNSGWFVSGGIAFAIRPDRNRPAPPPPPLYAPPPPMMEPMPAPAPMGPPAPSGPPGAPGPESAPAPAPAGPPAPTPTTTPM
jgi:hypothetical protein